MAGIKGRSGRRKKIDPETLGQLLELGWPMSRRMLAIEKLASLAEAGSIKATALLLAYGYGKPIERHEVMGKDGSDLFQRAEDFQSRMAAIVERHREAEDSDKP